MNLLVVDRSDSWHVNDLRRAAGDEHHIFTATFQELSATIENDWAGTEFRVNEKLVSEFDAILTRAMPASSLEQIVMRMDWLSQIEFQLKIPVVNPSKTIESSVDKYLSLEKLKLFNLPIPRTHICQTAKQAIQFFESNGCDSVLKPIFGSRGRQIERIQEIGRAMEKFEELEADGSVIYQQEYIEHGDSDVRVLVVGNKTFGMQRTRAGHWITNASLGATCEPYFVNELEHQLAMTAAHSQGAFLAGVDILYSNDVPYIVEINACPSWKHLSNVVQQDLSRQVLNLIEELAIGSGSSV